MRKEINTYRDLMVALSQLTEKQLEQPARFWSADAAGPVVALDVLEQDYVKTCDTVAWPIMDYWKFAEEKGFPPEDLPVVHKSGDVLIDVINKTV